jgi:acetyl esterase/lipase
MTFKALPGYDSPRLSENMIDLSPVKRFKKDLRYSEASPRNVLDIFYPETGEEPFPTIIFIHGGAFSRGDKNDMQLAAVLDGVNRGYAVASVEQRLLPECGFPYPLFDYKAAIRFLRAESADLMLDPSRFVAAGTSAGAYFAVLSAATQGIAAYEDLSMGYAGVSSDVAAALAFYGLYDLELESWFSRDQSERMRIAEMDYASAYLGVSARENPSIARFAGPVHFITQRFPPCLIQAGTGDAVVSYDDSVRLYERICGVCGEGRAELDSFPGAAHGDPAYFTQENYDRVFAWLHRTLK